MTLAVSTKSLNRFINRQRVHPIRDTLISTPTLSSNVGRDIDVWPARNDEASEAIRDIFTLARFIEFENGMDNEFRCRLVEAIYDYGSSAIDVIRKLLDMGSSDSDTIAMTLRYLGEIEHSPTYRQRFLLLTNSLSHLSPNVRDGAALGLAALDEPMSVSYLEIAIKNETISNLREDMKLVLDQLWEWK